MWHTNLCILDRLYPCSVISIFFTFCHKGGVICISEVIDIKASFQSSLLMLTALCSWQTHEGLEFPSIIKDVLSVCLVLGL